MGILRADLLTHSQLSNEGGSIVLDGSGDYLSFAAHSSFAPATADVTFELWFYLNADSDFNVDSADSNYYFFDMGSNGYRIQMYSGLLRFGIDGSTWTPPASGVSKTKWHHVAGVREGNSLDLYLDGKHVGQKSTTASVTSTSLTIGQYGGNLSYNGVPHGYISNFRYVRGVVYRGEFTPPKFELKNIPGTIVLGCQSSSSATDFAVTPSTISVGGNAAASSFHPGLKKDITDTGVVFDGFGSFATSTYMVPPKGKTTERNRGRAVFGGGATPSVNKTIDYVHIPSGGNAIDFGDKLTADNSNYALSNSIRGLWAGGRQPSASNVIEFITLATTANTIDFGDLTEARIHGASVSNSTRGIFMSGGTPTATNVMDYVTIATAGNAQDFGDTLTAGFTNGGGRSSSTRGIRAGNGTPAAENVIEFITIATTGNGQDFGDLTQASRALGAGNVSNGTRAVLMGGYTVPAFTNVMSFITIASAGDAQDFGDISSVRGGGGTASTITRGILAGGRTPTDVNTIDSIIIATIGNSTDFGDLTLARAFQPSGCSDSHGGLS